MNAPGQSPMIDDAILDGYVIMAQSLSLLILAACGLWVLEHGLDN